MFALKNNGAYKYTVVCLVLYIQLPPFPLTKKLDYSSVYGRAVLGRAYRDAVVCVVLDMHVVPLPRYPHSQKNLNCGSVCVGVQLQLGV